MVGTVRPVADSTADRPGVRASGNGSNPNTPRGLAQDRNSPLLTRVMFPKLTDEQWRERRAALRRHARLNQHKQCEQQQWPDKPRDPTRPSAVILDYFKTPRRRRRELDQTMPKAANTHDRSVLGAALQYAGRGWQVFPADSSGEKKSHKSSKHNNGHAWGKTTDATQIRCDFERWPRANVGIATGAETGFFVVETDTVEGHNVDGAAALRALEAEHGALPDTLMAESPSGSVHRYFKHPGGDTKIRSFTLKHPSIAVPKMTWRNAPPHNVCLDNRACIRVTPSTITPLASIWQNISPAIVFTKEFKLPAWRRRTLVKFT